MLAIDTNAFLRIFVNDNDIQSHKAKKFIQTHGVVFVSAIVLCETLWVLKSHLQYNKTQLIEFLEKILKASQFDFEHRDSLWTAFHQFQHSTSGITDCIIAAIAKLHGCDAVATFDKNAAKSKNFKLIQ